MTLVCRALSLIALGAVLVSHMLVAHAQAPSPTYTLTLPDAVTGDSAGGSAPQNFIVPGVTCVNCRIPDPNPPAGAGPVDSYTLDVYERPTQSGSAASVYYSALDIVSYDIGFDPVFFYFRIRLFGVDDLGSGKRLPFLYAYEINFDADPRGDLFVRSEDPSGKGLDDVFGTPGVIAYHDSNNNVGALNVLSPEGPGANVDGYNFLAFDQGANNVPGAPGGSDAVQARTILIGGIPHLELAVRRVFLNALNGGPVTQVSFRPYAAKGGGTTNPNQLYLHDQYGRLSAGSPYPWLQQAGAPATCPNSLADENALTPAQRDALNSGTNVNTGILNPCYPSGGNLVEFDNAGTVNDLASGATLSFDPPTVQKSFSSSTVGTDIFSTMSITLTAANAVTVTGVAFTDTYPSGLVNATPPNVTNTCGGTVTAAAGGGSLALTGGTIPGSGSCVVTVRVLSASAASYPNSTGPVTTANAGTAAAASATLTVLNRPAGGKSFSPATISGGDSSTLTITLTNSNAGTALTGVGFTDRLPAFPQQMLAAAPLSVANTCGGTLANNFGGALAAGDRGLQLAGATIPAGGSCTVSINVTASAGGAYVNTIPAGGISSANAGASTAAASATLTVSRIAGRVFIDNGNAGSDANNGVRNASETVGLAGARLTLSDCAGGVYATTTTDAAGDYAFAVPSGATALCVAKTGPGAYLATGASVGTTALPSGVPTAVAGTSYTYCRDLEAPCTALLDTIIWTSAAGTSYLELNFGVVQRNTLSPDGAQSGLPGTVLFYPHSFIAHSYGQVTFSTANAAAPANALWSETIYRDTNCNGQLDAGEPVLTAPVPITPVSHPSLPATICLIVRESLPANAREGASNAATVSAAFDYANDAPPIPAATATVSAVDRTTVGPPSGSGLRLVKSVRNCGNYPAAAPGTVVGCVGAFGTANVAGVNDVLEYQISFSNQSSEGLSSIVIADATAAFTEFLSAFSVTLPAPLSGANCQKTTPLGGPVACSTAQAGGSPPYTGAIVYNFGGAILAPGLTGTVSFQLRIMP